MRTRRAFADLFGVVEDLEPKYEQVQSEGIHQIAVTQEDSNRVFSTIEGILGVGGAVFWWMVPGLGINLGQSMFFYHNMSFVLNVYVQL